MTTDGTYGNAITGVWIDYDQSGTFDVSEFSQPFTNATSGSVNITIPLSATPGLTGMRVRSNWSIYTLTAANATTPFAEGETEDYIVTITAAPLCSGTPPVATVVSSVNPVGFGSPFTLSLTGLVNSGYLFQIGRAHV